MVLRPMLAKQNVVHATRMLMKERKPTQETRKMLFPQFAYSVTCAKGSCVRVCVCNDVPGCRPC